MGEAIAQVESNQNCQAVGRPTARGNRAYGCYQIMDFNIPNWTEEALHRAMTKEEFLADEEAQHLTAQYKLTKLLEKYSVEDVVAIWLSGQPLGVNNRADANGTTAFVYVDKVMRFYD